MADPRTIERINVSEVIQSLNAILELELAGVVRYTHYSLMIYGYSRIPIVSWLRDQATESIDHANKAGATPALLTGIYDGRSIPYDDPGADPDMSVEMFDILVGHAEAA